MSLRTLVAAVVSTAALAGASAPLFAQSLADVARQEEARRQALKEPAKVYTNKDLGSVAPASSVPVPDAEKDKDKTPAKDQAYWGGKVKELQAQTDRDQTYADAMQSRINALTADFAARDDPAQRALISSDRQKALAELDRLKLAIQNDKKALADLQEEARRAGVPPGWLR